MAEQISVKLFESFESSNAADTPALTGRKLKALLAYLVLNARIVCGQEIHVGHLFSPSVPTGQTACLLMNWSCARRILLTGVMQTGTVQQIPLRHRPRRMVEI